MKKLLLKAISKVQRLLLRSERSAAVSLYYKLAKTHYKLHFGSSLEKDTLEGTDQAYMAAKRHGRLVVSTLYKDSDPIRQRMVRAAARGSFVKNIILNASL